METERKNEIVSVRDQIDTIDDEILSLLKERLNCAKEIGKLKDEGKRAKWDPLRERQIYDRLFRDNNDNFPKTALKSIFHEIITTCRLSQKKAVVAFLGPEMPFVQKILFANLWLFKSLIKLNMEKANTSNALIRTTCVPTIISGGEKENVVPSLAYVLINFRILPGDTISTVVEHTKKVIDDPAITVSIYKGSFDTNPSPISSINSFGFNIIRNTIREIFKGTIVTPGLVVGATDSRHFAGICENIYRFVPYSFGKNDTDRIHGIDERIATEDYLNMIQFYAKLIQNSNAEK